MTARTVQTKFFEFHQNNSGGSFDIDDERGIGVNVWIEALNAADANDRAERLGIYFNGCSDGRDCDCCGDRWSAQWSDDRGSDKPDLDEKYDFGWHDTVYVHLLDGTIERRKSLTSQQPSEV